MSNRWVRWWRPNIEYYEEILCYGCLEPSFIDHHETCPRATWNQPKVDRD